ncbi:PD40 domain-containing protein [Streptomyces sp. SID13031]|uniref:TolB family protein n=1 Tax=Streptomyces sp. SID13031 TaxID=2706046 RepID=UPI0013CA5104|nr:PD40 domain-containing protein [Streptomyces sp. SID13031]NEA35522.1 biopolymer transporter Tol [Streptomyces sp. SID13031]
MLRKLCPGQTAELYVVDVVTNESRLVYASAVVLFEAPNWVGDRLVVNGDGGLFSVPVAGGELVPIELGGVPEINNDHVVGPDGATVYVSAEDGHLYAVPMAGGVGRRVSNEHGVHHYLHGVSPDGERLAYIGLANRGGRRITNVYTVPAAGGVDVQVTDDEFADDGSEYGPDGEWIYFNSERAGQAQLFRIKGAVVEQLTFDERVNWFPHPSPDGSLIAYVSFPPGTEGHPADVEDVRVRLLSADGQVREVATVFGGQGTMNVPSWSPDGSSFAYVAYPIK